jgi:hypothetical protein
LQTKTPQQALGMGFQPGRFSPIGDKLAQMGKEPGRDYGMTAQSPGESWADYAQRYNVGQAKMAADLRQPRQRGAPVAGGPGKSPAAAKQAKQTKKR